MKNLAVTLIVISLAIFSLAKHHKYRRQPQIPVETYFGQPTFIPIEDNYLKTREFVHAHKQQMRRQIYEIRNLVKKIGNSLELLTIAKQLYANISSNINFTSCDGREKGMNFQISLIYGNLTLNATVYFKHWQDRMDIMNLQPIVLQEAKIQEMKKKAQPVHQEKIEPVVQEKAVVVEIESQQIQPEAKPEQQQVQVIAQ